MPILKVRRILPCGLHKFVAPVETQARLGLNEREVLLFMATNKKQVLKRLLSLTLAVVMCFGFLPVPAAAASDAALTNGMPVTEENVLALIEEYRNGKEPGEKAKEAGFTSYSKGSTYDPYDPKYRIVLPSGPINGTECAKFAFAFWDDIFENTASRKVDEAWNVRPGDLLEYDTHWAIVVTKPYESPLYSTACVKNVGGGSSGSIGWDTIDQPLDFERGLKAIYTRYPD